MSLASKALSRGIGRIFNLPRLSVSLIVSLGLTLGAVLSVVAIASALLIKPLPGIEARDKLFEVDLALKLGDSINISIWNEHRLNHASQHFSDIGEWAGMTTSIHTVVFNGQTQKIVQYVASANTTQVMGTKLLLGAAVSKENMTNNIWISQGLWKNTFSGQDNVLGKVINIAGQSYIITGVLADFVNLDKSAARSLEQIWHFKDFSQALRDKSSATLTRTVNTVFLRLHNNVTNVPTTASLKQWMEAYVDKEFSLHSQEFYQSFAFNGDVQTFQQYFLGRSYQVIIALAAAVIGLLLMAVLNLLNLYLSHYQSRNKEFAIQLSLGASEWRMRYLLFLENLPSFILAGTLGLLVSGWLMTILPIVAGSSLPAIDSVTIDSLTLLSAMMLVITLAMLFSLLALADVKSHSLMQSLNSSGKGATNQQSYWLSRALMVGQLTVASLLVTGAVMLASSSYQHVYQDNGYELGNSYQLNINVKDDQLAEQLDDIKKYGGSQLQQLHGEINRLFEQKVAGSSVIINDGGPLTGSSFIRSWATEDGVQLLVQYRSLSATYFEQFNIEILAGKTLTQQQIDDNSELVVIDRELAKQIFPLLSYQQMIGKKMPFNESKIITAVVANVGALIGHALPAYYSSNISASDSLIVTMQVPKGQGGDFNSFRHAFNKAFPALELETIISLQDIWQSQTLAERTSLIILSTISILTLLLEAIGVAGLTLMSTHQKKYELAIRMATGASQWRLLRFILKDALWILIIGLGLGFTLSVFGYEWLRDKLSLLPEFNWLTLTWLDACLVIIVLLSVIIPAWRVIRQDPINALRQE
ncbi:MAG: ABC transporter permease [Psychrobium sp.]|nr:ABC transporter permease [Psychrobium sp.]